MDSSPPSSSVHGISPARIWNGLLFPSPGDLPHPGIKPVAPALADGLSTTGSTGKPKPTLLLSRFSRVQLCATPQMAAHQAPPSPGFFRQEHWSGLPFPSPVYESEKWKWSRSVSVWLLATPWTAAYEAPPSMGFSRQEYWSGVPSPSLKPTLTESKIHELFPATKVSTCHAFLLSKGMSFLGIKEHRQVYKRVTGAK